MNHILLNVLFLCEFPLRRSLSWKKETFWIGVDVSKFIFLGQSFENCEARIFLFRICLKNCLINKTKSITKTHEEFSWSTKKKFNYKLLKLFLFNSKKKNSFVNHFFLSVYFQIFLVAFTQTIQNKQAINHRQ